MITFTVLVIAIVNLVLMASPLTPYDEERLRASPVNC
jgi:hypothetical protein